MLHGSRHTDKARHSIQRARGEAGAMGSVQISPEHLLLGILAADRPAVIRVISRDASDVVERELRQQLGKGTGKMADDVDLPLSPEARNILKLGCRVGTSRVSSANRHI